LDVSHLKDGDVAGLALLQKHYGLAGVEQRDGAKFIIMISAESAKPVEMQRLPLTQSKVYFKADCDFADRKDIATFYYSLDGKSWKILGAPLKMKYTLPHFMGYRFGLFNYATKSVGGYADFDYFTINSGIN
jgi:beta-xylosidase